MASAGAVSALLPSCPDRGAVRPTPPFLVSLLFAVEISSGQASWRCLKPPGFSLGHLVGQGGPSYQPSHGYPLFSWDRDRLGSGRGGSSGTWVVWPLGSDGQQRLLGTLAPLPRSREVPKTQGGAGEGESGISRWLSPSALVPVWDPGS